VVAWIGFLPAVHNKVILEIVYLCECFGTLVTAVGFLFSWYASFSERNKILSLLPSIKKKTVHFYVIYRKQADGTDLNLDTLSTAVLKRS